jgi:predicted PurR-regulated permease PerM
VNRVLEVGVRVGLVALLGLWCFQIVRPFLQPIVWGIVIAVAVNPVYCGLERATGGRSRTAAALLVLGALLVLIGPTVALTASLVDTAANLAGELHGGAMSIPPPPDFIATWPLIGEPLHAFWTEANQNLEAALMQIAPQLKTIGLWLVSTGATTGIGIVKFVISILIAGVFLANGRRAASAVRSLAIRLVGDRGGELTDLARAAVQSVTRGILGVALIQSLLAGVGLLAVGVPAAGLWALLVLVLAVMQLPTLLVLGPIIAYVFSTSTLGIAVAFGIWATLVGLVDNVLKPLLMGRGVDVPMLVLFMGAIGGFMLDGIIGLFTGAVVLALGYTLVTAWLEPGAGAEDAPPLAES